jgi:hypothetical protein
MFENEPVLLAKQLAKLPTEGFELLKEVETVGVLGKFSKESCVYEVLIDSPPRLLAVTRHAKLLPAAL